MKLSLAAYRSLLKAINEANKAFKELNIALKKFAEIEKKNNLGRKFKKDLKITIEKNIERSIKKSKLFIKRQRR